MAAASGNPARKVGSSSSRGGVALESIDPGLELPFVREIAAWSSASCLRILGCGQASCGEASDSTTCARTRTGHSTRSLCRSPFQIRARMGESAPQTMGPRFGATTSGQSSCAAARQHRPQCARRRQPLLDVGHHGNQALQQAVVAGGRVRAYLEPRPGERILRSGRPPEHLSADAERPDQCWRGRAVRVQDLVGQDLRHVRRALGTCGSRRFCATSPGSPSGAHS